MRRSKRALTTGMQGSWIVMSERGGGSVGPDDDTHSHDVHRFMSVEFSSGHR